MRCAGPQSVGAAGWEENLATHPLHTGFASRHRGVVPAWWQAQPWPRLQGWLAQWQASSLLASVMEKYPAWMDGEVGITFPPA